MQIILGCKSVYLDLAQDNIVMYQRELPLSRTQIHVMHKLAINIGHPVKTRDLIQAAWGSKIKINKNSYTKMYVFMHRLRRSIMTKHKEAPVIVTIYGFGYLLKPCQDNKSLSNR